MSSIQFKLSQRGGLTRRVAFPTRPSWESLSFRIGELYGIPADKIAVSYIDKDGDEVTLSSEEELTDFYDVEASSQGQAPIKFVVQDLRSLRGSQNEALPDLPGQRENIRNTFGGVFDVDGEWQLPNIGFFRRSEMTGPDTHHAFLEVVQSEGDAHTEPSELGSSKQLDEEPPEFDKGKGRAYEASITETISSTGSVLAEDAPPKPPVHVYDVNSQNDNGVDIIVEHTNPIALTSEEPVVPIPTESTPKAAVHSLNTAEEGTAPDPPLPSFEPPTSTLTASLSHDVATLLGTFSKAISSHPEISEGMRNIVRNVTNGDYWHTHRRSIAHAAEEISRQAQTRTGRAAEEVRRIAEEDAGRRVAEALGEIFRLFSNTTAGRASNVPAANTAPPAATEENQVPPPPPSSTSQKPTTLPPPPPPPPPPIPSLNGRPTSWYSGPGAPNPWSSAKPWEAPGYRPWWAHRTPPRVVPPSAHYPGPYPYPPPPPPPLPPFSNAPLYHPSVPIPPPPPPPPGATLGMYSSPFEDPSTMTAEELKADLELTKQRYKTEKELYRAQRGERRKDKDRKRNSNVDGEPEARDTKDGEGSSAPKPFEGVTQIVSNARGPYPQLEIVSVSHKRNRSFAGRNSSIRAPAQEAVAAAIHRITKRLADMGFMAQTYPSIPSQVKAQIPANGVTSKEIEDDIVTNMLEELLAMSPRPPVASSSRPKRDRDVPGSWR